MALNIIERNSKVLCWLMFLASLVAAGISVGCLVAYKNQAGGYLDETLFLHVVVSLWGGLYGPAWVMLSFRLFPNVRTSVVKYFHGMGHVLCLGTLIFGAWKGFQANDDADKDGDEAKHLRTTHAMLSVVLFTLYGLNFVVAMFVFIYMRTSQKVRRYYAAMHSFVGFIVAVLSVVICCQGVQYMTIDRTEKEIPYIPLSYGNCLKYCLFSYFIIVFLIIINPFFEWPEVGNI